ncbi:MAG: hypothetical protein AYK22_09055 [Thermoplasmatales archaeon SG8-52-3]|nr:MAG: hypothetical protein AYK22_09055 [Thermoplasmatales archaeon SG8-52-3]
MDSEKEIIISFLFKRSGKEHLKFSELYLALSMELNWFTPDDAKSFITLALEENLIEKKGDLLKPNFDYENTTIPIGFSPSKRVFEIKKAEKKEEIKETILEEMIKILIEKSNLDKSKITKKIDDLAKEKNITEEVAALLIGKEYILNFENFFEKVEESIFKG